jgi:hypothetical protein
MRLMADGQPDDQVITALAQRRVDPAKAAQLVDDLRNGRNVMAKSSLPSEFTLRRSRSRSAAREGASASSRRAPKPEPRVREPLSQPPAPGRKKPAVIWVVAGILLFLALVVIGSVLFQRYQPGAASSGEPTSDTSGAIAKRASRESPAAPAHTARKGPQSSLVLELQPDGLRLLGKLVTRENLLPSVISLLGPPNRTNQISQTKTVIYAFDQHGLLIYSQPDRGTNSIVLDCEASGGTNGTTSPFAGTLRVEGQIIGPETDSRALAAIKPLGLAAPKVDGTIWNGRYKDVDLVFAYLRSPRRLSLIELDLK